jgi:hypothetical protein
MFLAGFLAFVALWGAFCVDSLSAKIPVDKNNRLSENVYVVLGTAPKKWLKAEPVGRRTIQVSAEDDVFADAETVAACFWKGYPADYIKDTLNAAKATDSLIEFVRERCDHLEIGFVSYFEGEVLKITWIHPETNQPMDSHVQELQAGERNTAWVHTMPGHKFMVKGKSFEQTYEAIVPSIHIVGSKPDYTTLGRTITEENKIARIRGELARVRKIKRIFTDVGFKKIKVPRNVWSEIST